MSDPKTLADKKKKSVRVWRILTNCREQGLVRPIVDQNIYLKRGMIEDGGCSCI